MSMTLPQVADAVAARLNQAAFNTGAVEFDAVRLYLPKNDLASMATTDLQVLVFVAGDDVSVLSRQDQLEEVRISIAILQKLGPEVDPTTAAGNAAIDPLVNLCQQIALSCGPGAYLDSPTGTQWVESKYAPVFDYVEMSNNRTFVAVVNFKFQQTD